MAFADRETTRGAAAGGNDSKLSEDLGLAGPR